MATDQMSLPVRRRETSVSHRLLGTIGMLVAPMLFLEGMLYSFGYADGTKGRFVPVLGILYLVGWAASATAMRQVRVTGDNAFGKTIYLIQMAGLSLAMLFNVQEIIYSSSDENSLFFRVTDAAWPLSHLFMLVVGVAVLAAKVWRGWRTVTPFLCGLALPAFFAVGPVIGREPGGMIFGILTTCAFMLLGYAVRTSQEAEA
jgi:hypothetical protein